MTPAGSVRAPEKGPVEFPTRVDNWLLAVLVGSCIISIAAMVLAVREDPAAAVIGLLVVLGTVALIVALAVPTRYTVGAEVLEIRSGLLRHRIPLRGIRRVAPSRNPLSAPAWSLRRLRIDYLRDSGAGGFTLISPQREEDFLRLLAARAGLDRVGSELHREGV